MNQKRLHIMHVLAGGKIGGAERSLEWFMRTTDMAEFEHEFAFLYFGGIVQATLENMGHSTYVLDWLSGYSIAGRWRLVQLIAKRKPDIVHFHETTPLVKVFVKSAFPHLTIVSTCHGVEWNSLMARLGQSVDDKFIDFVICHSDYTLTAYEASYGRKRKIARIHLGLCLDQYRTRVWKHVRARPLNRSRISTEMIYLGRVEEHKGVLDLPALALKLRQMGIGKFRIQVVGDGSASGRLRQLIKAMDVEQEIFLAGAQKDPLPWLQNAHILVFPSWREESFGLVLLEALACGLAVVAYDSGAVSEVIGFAPGAALVEKNNIAQMAAAISSIVLNQSYPDLLDCRTFIERRFDFAATAREIEAVYVDLAGRL